METTQISNQEANGDWRNRKIMEEEQLIKEVHKRPALWNFKLPLVERRLQVKKKLWEEIFASMNGTMDIATIKKKWKSLCDSFRIYRNKQRQPSGSARTRESIWVHFERMQFLCDMQLENETTTNIPAYENYEESNDGDNIICDDSSTSSDCGSRNNKRRLSMDDFVEETLDRFADAFDQPVTVNMPPFIPPPPTPSDKTALFGNLIAAQLREVDPQLVDDTMLQVMQIINAAKRKKIVMKCQSISTSRLKQ